MKTKNPSMKTSINKNIFKKRSVGRPRKSKIKVEPLSDISIDLDDEPDTFIREEKLDMFQLTKDVQLNSFITEHRVCIF